MTFRPAPNDVAVEPAERLIPSRSGLQLPMRLPFERWLAIGRHLSAVSTWTAWCAGDWLAFGARAYPGRYRQAIEHTSLDYQTLRNYAWVARQVPMPRRREALTFGHHAEVAALPEAEQDFWLRKAEQHQWPVKQLRRQVRASLEERSGARTGKVKADPSTGEWVVLSLRVRLARGQLETCQAAADKANLSIEAWTALALEQAARQQLGCEQSRQSAD